MYSIMYLTILQFLNMRKFSKKIEVRCSFLNHSIWRRFFRKAQHANMHGANDLKWIRL